MHEYDLQKHRQLARHRTTRLVLHEKFVARFQFDQGSSKLYTEEHKMPVTAHSQFDRSKTAMSCRSKTFLPCSVLGKHATETDMQKNFKDG